MMRAPPKLRLPATGTLMPVAMRQIKEDVEAVMAWMQEAVEIIEAATQPERHPDLQALDPTVWHEKMCPDCTDTQTCERVRRLSGDV